MVSPETAGPGVANLASPFFFVLLLVVLLAPAFARAQMLLPGALQAQPEGGFNASPGSAGSGTKMPKPAVLKPLAVQSVLGHELAQNGSSGTIAFRSGPEHGLGIVKLSLAGESMSHPGESCVADVAATELVKTKLDGRPNGAFAIRLNSRPVPLLSRFWKAPSLFRAAQNRANFKVRNAAPILPGSGARREIPSARIRQSSSSVNAAAQSRICE
jgi:hypothetical protein